MIVLICLVQVCPLYAQLIVVNTKNIDVFFMRYKIAILIKIDAFSNFDPHPYFPIILPNILQSNSILSNSTIYIHLVGRDDWTVAISATNSRCTAIMTREVYYAIWSLFNVDFQQLWSWNISNLTPKKENSSINWKVQVRYGKLF